MGMGETHTILIGGGGHAKVVLDAALRAGIELHGFVDDDDDAPITRLRGCPARVGALRDVRSNTDFHPLIAVGDLSLRRELIDAFTTVEYALPIAHPSAVIAPSSTVALGGFVGAGAIINADAKVCAHAIINTGAIVEHDCRVGINTHIAPGAVLGGGVVVGDDTLVGIGATVLPGVKIGGSVIVGAGAVVIEDVEDGATVVGVPARVVGVGV
jgi:sugar O-acyltransferase (sialic acid O-acetyltransferase NeuD family)